MHALAQRAGSFAVDHAHGQDAALPALGKVVGQQFGDLVRTKRVQVQLAGDWNLNGLFIEWFGIVSHRRIGGGTMIHIALAAIVFAVAAYSAEPVKIKFTGSPGPYTVERWRADWPGCEWEDGVKEGHVSLTQRESKNWLRVDYAVGEIGPEKCGAGWRYPIGKHETAELRYTVRFGKDFDWVKGGKLPGLSGGPDNVSGGRPATGMNGFSARLMWRTDGRGEAYVYHKNQSDNYGDRFSFPNDFHFPTDTPVQVRIRVSMNEVGKRNGKLYVWIRAGESSPERLLVSRTSMEWRSVATFGVDSVYFETFHGGSDKTWAPTKPCWAEFGEMRVDPQ